jgi:uncharacterized heparinase superfamily protein
MHVAAPSAMTKHAYISAKFLYLGTERTHMEPNWENREDVLIGNFYHLLCHSPAVLQEANMATYTLLLTNTTLLDAIRNRV